jgi:hypothetical protein
MPTKFQACDWRLWQGARILFQGSLFFLCSICYPQSLSVSVGAERNVSCMESQLMMGYQNGSEWLLGAFYQNKMNVLPLEQSTEAKGGEWFGLVVNAPLVRTKKIGFYGQLRTGLVNQRFLLIAPSLETKIIITKWLAVGSGTGYRYGYPTFFLKTQITLFKANSHENPKIR